MALTTQETTTINNNINILKTCRRYDFYGDLEKALTPGDDLSRMGAFWDYTTLFDSSLGPSLNDCITAISNTYTFLDGKILIDHIRERSSEILTIPKPESYYYVIYKYCLKFPVFKYIFEEDIFFLFRHYHMSIDARRLIYANPLNSPPETYSELPLSSPDYKKIIEVSISDVKEKYLKTLEFLQDCPVSTFRPTLLGHEEFSRLIGLAYNYIRGVEKSGVNDWFKHVNIGPIINPGDNDLTNPSFLSIFLTQYLTDPVDR